MKCNFCGIDMSASSTNFSVVKWKEVYVVNNVPCWECPICGHISFEQEITKRLERFTSGRIVAFTHCRAWCFDWADDIIEIGRERPASSSAVSTGAKIEIPSTVV
jgi:YgiT-type zinc finger domain-containing protein